MAQQESVNWPTAVEKKQWERFYHKVYEVLETALEGDVGKKDRGQISPRTLSNTCQNFWVM